MTMFIDKNTGARIVESAKGWLGTPHLNAHKNKGVGVDCARLIEASLEDSGLYPEGFLKDMDTSYTSDWHLNNGKNIMIPIIEGYCEEIHPDSLQEGDILTFQIGRQIGHCAIYIGDGNIIHSFPDLGVHISNLETDFHLYDKKGRSRLKKVYRLKEEY